jgi:hypothetical protein
VDIDLMEHQINAIELLGNGKILYGEVGTGKSATVMAYYMEKEAPRDIYVITTAKKRDSLDWLGEAARFGIGDRSTGSLAGVIAIDSWNNIDKYLDVTDAFFIFDEQRLVGSGAWVKAFLKISKKNHWVMLTATPGDVWSDYAPVFIANGWYKNFTDFRMQHIVLKPYVKFPIIDRYVGTDKLERYRNEILVEMPYTKPTKRYLNYMEVDYDLELWHTAVKRRWNPYTDKPIKDVAELFRVMRRISNTDPSRIEMIMEIMKVHPKLIIFYNFNYELEILQGLCVYADVAEWNGHRKDPIPDSDKWVYLVQYVAGAEGWNCVETDAMVLYSLTFSYKNFVQCQGRIDRLNTRFRKLYYYILINDSIIDRSVKEALNEKRSFNERKFMRDNERYVDF